MIIYRLTILELKDVAILYYYVNVYFWKFTLKCHLKIISRHFRSPLSNKSFGHSTLKAFLWLQLCKWWNLFQKPN
jgi:hypothetical protein